MQYRRLPRTVHHLKKILLLKLGLNLFPSLNFNLKLRNIKHFTTKIHLRSISAVVVMIGGLVSVWVFWIVRDRRTLINTVHEDVDLNHWVE